MITSWHSTSRAGGECSQRLPPLPRLFAPLRNLAESDRKVQNKLCSKKSLPPPPKNFSKKPDIHVFFYFVGLDNSSRTWFGIRPVFTQGAISIFERTGLYLSCINFAKKVACILQLCSLGCFCLVYH